MTLQKARGAARKGAQKRRRFGHKIVKVLVGTDKTSFTVYEDLLCSNSGFFKKRLQPSRKPINGDCSICSEDFAGFAQVSYCAPCGQNFYTNCSKNWLGRERKCPLCHEDWRKESKGIPVHHFALTSIDSTLFDVYIQWLYSGVIPACWKFDHKNNTELRLAQSIFYGQFFGEEMEDSGLQLALCQNIVEFSLATEAPLAPLCDSIVRFVYVQTKPDSFTRRFLVDLCAAGVTTVDLTCKLPMQFLVGLTKNLLSRKPIDRTEMRQALAGYLGQGEEGDGEEEAEEAEEEEEEEEEEEDEEGS